MDINGVKKIFTNVAPILFKEGSYSREFTHRERVAILPGGERQPFDESTYTMEGIGQTREDDFSFTLYVETYENMATLLYQSHFHAGGSFSVTVMEEDLDSERLSETTMVALSRLKNRAARRRDWENSHNAPQPSHTF